MKLSKNKKRIIILSADFILLTATIVAMQIIPNMVGGPVTCIAARLHLPCPGCGGTRCLYNFLTGHFIESFNFNPFIFACIIAAIVIVALFNLSWLFNLKFAEKALQNASNPVFAYGFLIVFIIFLALRAFHILPMP